MAVSVFSKASRSICGRGLGCKLFIITGVGELKPRTQNGLVVWLENILLVTCSVGFSMWGGGREEEREISVTIKL